MSTYKCIHCNKIVERESDKQWIKSYCEEIGKYVRLQKQKAPDGHEEGVGDLEKNEEITDEQLSQMKKLPKSRFNWPKVSAENMDVYKRPPWDTLKDSGLDEKLDRWIDTEEELE